MTRLNTIEGVIAGLREATRALHVREYTLGLAANVPTAITAEDPGRVFLGIYPTGADLVFLSLGRTITPGQARLLLVSADPKCEWIHCLHGRLPTLEWFAMTTAAGGSGVNVLEMTCGTFPEALPAGATVIEAGN